MEASRARSGIRCCHPNDCKDARLKAYGLDRLAWLGFDFILRLVRFADLLDPPENPYVCDPVGWVTSSLGEFWWSGQHRMAQLVVENRYSAFKASHDVSKSHTMSRLALWWIDGHPPGEAFVVTTAPTTPQVEAILWRYMRNAHKKGGLPGRITLDAKW